MRLHIDRGTSRAGAELGFGPNVADGLVDTGDLGHPCPGQGARQVADPGRIGREPSRAVVDRAGDEDRSWLQARLEPARNAEADQGADAGADVVLDQSREPRGVTAPGQDHDPGPPSDPGLGRETGDGEDPSAGLTSRP